MNELSRITSKVSGIKYKIKEIEFMKIVIQTGQELCYVTQLWAIPDVEKLFADLKVRCGHLLRPNEASANSEFDIKFKEKLISAFEHALFYDEIKPSDKPVVINLDEKGNNLLGLRYECIGKDIDFKYKQKDSYKSDKSETTRYEILKELNCDYSSGIPLQKLRDLIFFDNETVRDSFERLLTDNHIRERDCNYIIMDQGAKKMEDLKVKIGRKEHLERSIGF